MLVDLQRVLAEQIGRRRLVDEAGDGLGAIEGLAEPDHSGIGVDLHPQKIGKLLERYRLDCGNLHVVSPLASGLPPLDDGAHRQVQPQGVGRNATLPAVEMWRRRWA